MLRPATESRDDRAGAPLMAGGMDNRFVTAEDADGVVDIRRDGGGAMLGRDGGGAMLGRDRVDAEAPGAVESLEKPAAGFG